MTADRPAPVITVSIPGRGETPSELLAVGPPPQRTPRLPLRDRLTGLSAAVVLVAGMASVASYEDPPTPPRVLPPTPVVTGIEASVSAVEGSAAFVERLRLLVAVAPAGGRGDSGSPSDEDDVALLAVLARGFALTLDGAALPQDLQVSRQRELATFEVEARVVDCSVDTQAPRAVSVQVRRGGGRPALVRATAETGVVRALDRLVRRSCRRPRG